jgi:hypothetical protein
MKCPFCGRSKISKNGIKRGMQRFICTDCKKNFIPTSVIANVDQQPTTRLEVVTPERLEELLLNGIAANCMTSPQWAKLAIQVLEHIYPKFKDIGGKKFTPDDYKVFLEDMSKVDIAEIAKLALKEKNEPSE